MDINTFSTVALLFMVFVLAPAFPFIILFYVWISNKFEKQHKRPAKWLVTEHELCALSDRNRAISARQTKARDRFERRQRRRALTK